MNDVAGDLSVAAVGCQPGRGLVPGATVGELDDCGRLLVEARVLADEVSVLGPLRPAAAVIFEPLAEWARVAAADLLRLERAVGPIGVGVQLHLPVRMGTDRL